MKTPIFYKGKLSYRNIRRLLYFINQSPINIRIISSNTFWSKFCYNLVAFKWCKVHHWYFAYEKLIISVKHSSSNELLPPNIKTLLLYLFFFITVVECLDLPYYICFLIYLTQSQYFIFISNIKKLWLENADDKLPPNKHNLPPNLNKLHAALGVGIYPSY